MTGDDKFHALLLLVVVYVACRFGRAVHRFVNE